MSLFARWDRWLIELREQGRFRKLSAPSGIDFSSNDYLGYCGSRSNPVKGASHDAKDWSGTASRLLRGHHPAWDEVESALALWHGAESALMMTSGYGANEGLLATVIEPGDWVASDEFNHASIIDGLRLCRAERFVYRHRDLGHLEEGLRSAARHRLPGNESFIVTESWFGMEGDQAHLVELTTLAERHGAHLIVDEAHATGCYGPVGSGLVDDLGLRSRVLATVHTGGKALGVMGAYICCSTKLREILINRCRHLIFTTALPPALSAPWLDAIKRAQDDFEGRELLHGNAAFVRERLSRRGQDVSGSGYIVPVILGDDKRATNVAKRLQERGWDVRAIRPPTVPNGTARLRISIHADHDRDTLADLANSIGDLVSAR